MGSLRNDHCFLLNPFWLPLGEFSSAGREAGGAHLALFSGPGALSALSFSSLIILQLTLLLFCTFREKPPPSPSQLLPWTQ